MGHTPFGYRIENGIAIIDKPAAAKLRLLYKNYLSGMSLSKAAAEAGIPTYHGTAKRLMETVHYLGDSFYPAIIDKDTYQKAQEERKRRATKLGRNNKQTQMRTIQIEMLVRGITIVIKIPSIRSFGLICRLTIDTERSKSSRPLAER